ncbi:carbohydrate kinase family protein [Actinocorallia sp. A-T 12471]|uniref:carbohydrate kinase family protein n=1 Tax=Actinocorallia sp. A-T 12471 TaxID=3089813 RepID=UPI0029D2C598|nr:carbohydrate kinase family protein [Actinocorallia sp. A-T 12471]MDX6743212.1 carbohydrate kinase family protein [Actinocorallia sp. A-T 12471]
MRIAVTGSIATDHLMTFPGRFSDQLLPDQLAQVSLSFLVDELEIRRGGIAANISYGLGSLGLRPLLVGSVGADFADYRAWLERHGVDCAGVHVSELRHTARFMCTTDTDHNQIASFYAGAMAEARNIELAPLGEIDLVVVSPNDPEAMVRHTDECRDRGIAFAADPSQQLARMDGAEVRSLIGGARFLFTNEYEKALCEQKSGWTDADVLDRVDIRVTTLGAKGVVIDRKGEPGLHVPAAPDVRKVEPTGIGDAFRAGFLAAVAWDLSLERAAQLGNLLAAHALETAGGQEYSLDKSVLIARMSTAYGPEAATEIATNLT